MKRVLTAILLCLVLSMPSLATWNGWLPVSDDQVELWLTKPSGKVSIGGYGIWVDEDAQPEVGNQFGGGVIATYDLLEGATFVVGNVTIPVQWSIGVRGGLLYSHEVDDLDPASSLLTMFRFGEPNMGLAVIYEYDVSENLWDTTLPRENIHTLSVSPYFQF